MREPTDTERLLIAGRTGSGKSQEALWRLSQRRFDERPWCLLDFKGGDLLAACPVTAVWSIHDDPPPEPGLYYLKAEPEEGKGNGPVSQFLRKIYAQGRTGTLIDEGMCLGHQCSGLRLLLTQGRSKECPLIICTQRPVFLDLYAWSESEYIQVFQLQLAEDKERVIKSFPEDTLDFQEIVSAGMYHSLYYDTRAGTTEMLGPCPDWDTIYNRIYDGLPVYEYAENPAPAVRVRL